MLVKCYRLWSNDWGELDRLGLYVQRVQGWVSIGVCYVDYFVPETEDGMFLLMNDRLEYRWRDSWIV